jgi:hypothetical protein
MQGISQAVELDFRCEMLARNLERLAHLRRAPN